MRFCKALHLGFAILLTASCSAEKTFAPLADFEADSVSVNYSAAETESSIPLSAPTSRSETPTPPAWVADFAEPILKAIANVPPTFKDDFSINRRWFLRTSESPRLLFAEIHDDLLFLRLPESKRSFSILSNAYLNYKNFALTLDLIFYHNQPNDRVHFQFDRSGNSEESVKFDLSNNRNWALDYKNEAESGVYPHFPPERVPVTILMQGTACAIYVNNSPLIYAENCRTSPSEDEKAWRASFRLFKDHRGEALVNLDNLKIWDLDRLLISQ